MSRIAYVNGRYRPQAAARVHIEDRGFQFADGVYEVIYLAEGQMVDAALHLDRLDRSLSELRIAAPMGRPALRMVLGEVARRNRILRGLLYMQITRGQARRDHPFPPPGTTPSLVVTAKRLPAYPTDVEAWAARAITYPDQRWARCDIKSVALLPNVLAKQAARERGALEALLIAADGTLTEGSSSSVFVVDAAGRLRTRPVDAAILPGCTRAVLVRLLAERQIGWDEGPVSEAELRGAREVMITSASNFVRPIVAIDGVRVGTGEVGPIARRLFDLYAEHVRSSAR